MNRNTIGKNEPLWMMGTTPDAVNAYMLAEASLKIQSMMAAQGKKLVEDKVGMLVLYIQLLAKTPRRQSTPSGIPHAMEYYDSIAMRNISSAIDMAINLIPYRKDVEMILCVLGRFSSFRDCGIAPKGTRNTLLAIATKIKNEHTKSTI